GRRWSDGLHQAVEAKEGVKIERENQTLATVTLQNYFRMYEKLSGMTGTAKTEEAEFLSTYKIDVVTIPTHRSMVRKDMSDVIYRTLPEKWTAVAEEIKQKYEIGQPVLVGTVSVETSELISSKLKELKIPHNVLNAKYHEREAEIVAQAGRKGAVTIATNMAGRGTDILLGGNAEFLAREALKHQQINPDEAEPELIESEIEKIKPQVEAEHEEVVQIGGLHIVGTERHESRRIDNQLRGRAGRQGDPGSSRFVLSLEDDLMRIFAGDKVRAMMEWLGMEEGVAIESGTVTKRIEGAQKNVEGRNFETRKHVLQYDDVMNKQRETIYGLRRQLLEQPDNREYLVGDTGVASDLLSDLTAQFLRADVRPDDWDIEGFTIQIKDIYNFDAETSDVNLTGGTSDEIRDSICIHLKTIYAEKETTVGAEAMRAYERYIMLEIIDSQWKDHLLSIDHLKQGIGLVGYGQKDPVVEYKKQSFEMFQAMLDRIDTLTTRALFHLEIVSPQEAEDIEAERQRRKEAARRKSAPAMTFTGANATASAAGEEAAKAKPFKRTGAKLKPNDACHCGSGKKFKKCHGVGI
ncbi:MAG: SEC-C domain-containing protein, partial [Pyrinomonadaceae bacterium]|nr:SEC-C domain-containing protein [Pyrinomonadaceae bacterium]